MSNILDRLNIRNLSELSAYDLQEIHNHVQTELVKRTAPEMIESVNHYGAMLPYHKRYMREDFKEVLLMYTTEPTHIISIGMNGHTASVENMEWNTGVEI